MARRVGKKKVRGSGYHLWVGFVLCLACFGAYQLAQMARNAVLILQQQGVPNRSLWQMIQVRFWESDVPQKPKKRTVPKKKPAGFSRQDKDKLERILQDNLQDNAQ